MEYLTVKDVATLVRRNEETIRRMIRARKLDVSLDNNNRKQGYLIPVDQLTRTFNVSPEAVRRYIDARNSEEGSAVAPAEAQGDPSAPACVSDMLAKFAAIGETVTSALRQGAERIAREMNRITDAARSATPSEDNTAAVADGGSNMAQDLSRRNEGGSDKDAPSQGSRNLCADFSEASAKVGEIFSDTCQRIKDACNAASTGHDANQNQYAVRRAEEARSAARRQAAQAAELGRRAFERNRDMLHNAAKGYTPSSRPDADTCGPDDAVPEGAPSPAADMARRTRETSQSIIREAIEKVSGHVDAMRTEGAAPLSARATCADAERTPPEAENAAAPCAKAPVLSGFDKSYGDFGDIPDAKGFEFSEDNASYRMLQAARRAVKERGQADNAVPPACGEAAHTSDTAGAPDAAGMNAGANAAISRQAPTPSAHTPDTAGAPDAAGMNAGANAAISLPDAASAVEPAQPAPAPDSADALARRVDNIEAKLDRLARQLDILLARHSAHK